MEDSAPAAHVIVVDSASFDPERNCSTYLTKNLFFIIFFGVLFLILGGISGGYIVSSIMKRTDSSTAENFNVSFASGHPLSIKYQSDSLQSLQTWRQLCNASQSFSSASQHRDLFRIVKISLTTGSIYVKDLLEESKHYIQNKRTIRLLDGENYPDGYKVHMVNLRFDNRHFIEEIMRVIVRAAAISDYLYAKIDPGWRNKSKSRMKEFRNHSCKILSSLSPAVDSSDYFPVPELRLHNREIVILQYLFAKDTAHLYEIIKREFNKYLVNIN